MLSKTIHNHNLKNLSQCKTALYPIHILKHVSLKLLALSANEPAKFLLWWDTLKIVVVNSLQIVSNFTNPKYYWKKSDPEGLATEYITTLVELDSLFHEMKNQVGRPGILKILTGK